MLDLYRWLLFASILVVLLIPGACSSFAELDENLPSDAITITKSGPITSQELVIIDGLGRKLTLDLPAQRIISLAPSNTEILFAIGAGSQIVGREAFSDYPPEAQEITSVGGDFGELNTELIVSLNPDLILASELTPLEQVQGLQDLGLTIFVLANPVDFESLYSNLSTAAMLTGHEQQAQELIQTLRSRVEAVQDKIPATVHRPVVFYELDGSEADAPWTAGSGTFIDMLIRMAGGENLGGKLEGEWIQISAEELISQNPEIIILGDFTWGGVTPNDVSKRNGWDVISAVQNGRVFTFDDNLVSRPGPRLIEGLEKMAQLIHPELFTP